jgi:hypothetical protein
MGAMRTVRETHPHPASHCSGILAFVPDSTSTGSQACKMPLHEALQTLLLTQNKLRAVFVSGDNPKPA